MIDNTEWKYIYKIYDDGNIVPTNVLYVPSMNSLKDKMCMHFDRNAEYYMPRSCVSRTEEMMEYFFRRELKYISMMQGQSFCPRLYDIDEKHRKILIEWNKESLNPVVYTPGRSLDDISPHWEKDLYSVIKSIYDLGYYKLALYPHCFFYDKNLQLKTFDYYSLVDRSNPYILKEIVDPIIGEDSHTRYIEVNRGDYYDFELFFKNTLKNWLKWPNDATHKIYKKMFDD